MTKKLPLCFGEWSPFLIKNEVLRWCQRPNQPSNAKIILRDVLYDLSVASYIADKP